MKLKLTLEYNGAAFSGWQYQENSPTVQAEIERALEIYLQSVYRKQGRERASSTPLRINGSGRTDAGVHALAQVASFSWPDELEADLPLMLKALNGITSQAIAITSLERVAENFDARFSPHIKQYRYNICLRPGGEAVEGARSWIISESLDLTNMLIAARLFSGEHDFKSFRASDCAAKTTVRTVLVSELTRTSGNSLSFVIQGRGFLKQMVRMIVGTLVSLGKGQVSLEQVKYILEGGERAGIIKTAPAKGLVMDWVRYL